MKNFLKIYIDSHRVYGLDILRCCAILFVIIGHSTTLLPLSVGYYVNFLYFDGVGMFYVLSGFLIGGILIKQIEKGDVAPKALFGFWVRRWYRTLPAYYLVLIILIILEICFNSNFQYLKTGRYFYFSQNLFYEQPYWLFPESWSLSVEEWFYVLIPILIFTLIGIRAFSKKHAVTFTVIFIIVTVTAFRLYRYSNIAITDYSVWDLQFRKQVFTRLDSLMFGVIGAYIAYYYKTSWLKFKKELLVLGIIILLMQQFYSLFIMNLGLYFCVFSFSVNSIGVLCLLPFLSDLKKGEGKLFNAITYISLISYSMYLLNYSFIQGWILGNINLDFLATFGIVLKYIMYWFITITLSIILYKYFEVPMTKLRDKK